MPHVSLQAMQVSIGSAKYNQIMEVARKSDDQLGSANALLEASVLLDKGDAAVGWSTLKTFVTGRLAADPKKGLSKATGWISAVSTGLDGATCTDADKAKFLLAGMKRGWDGQKYAKILKQCRSLLGQGDASMGRMAEWFYLFAFKWEKPLAETDVIVPGAAPRVATGGAGTPVRIFDNRLTHITDGHTFRHYVFHQDEINNLSRAMGGIQTFWPDHYGWLEIYNDLTSTLQNDAAIRNAVAAGTAGAVAATTPFHLRVVLATSGQGAYRVQTAFPAAIAQPNTHRIPQKFLEYVYELMAPSLGMTTLRVAQSGQVTAFDRAMAAARTNQ